MKGPSKPLHQELLGKGAFGAMMKVEPGVRPPHTLTFEATTGATLWVVDGLGLTLIQMVRAYMVGYLKVLPRHIPDQTSCCTALALPYSTGKYFDQTSNGTALAPRECLWEARETNVPLKLVAPVLAQWQLEIPKPQRVRRPRRQSQ